MGLGLAQGGSSYVLMTGFESQSCCCPCPTLCRWLQIFANPDPRATLALPVSPSPDTMRLACRGLFPHPCPAGSPGQPRRPAPFAQPCSWGRWWQGGLRPQGPAEELKRCQFRQRRASGGGWRLQWWLLLPTGAVLRETGAAAVAGGGSVSHSHLHRLPGLLLQQLSGSWECPGGGLLSAAPAGLLEEHSPVQRRWGWQGKEALLKNPTPPLPFLASARSSAPLSQSPVASPPLTCRVASPPCEDICSPPPPCIYL